MLKTRVLSGSSIVPLSWRDDLGLTKPRVFVFLLLTTWSAMLMASGQLPSFWVTLWTLSGSDWVAGGASAHPARQPRLEGSFIPGSASWRGGECSATIDRVVRCYQPPFLFACSAICNPFFLDNGAFLCLLIAE